MSLRGLWRAWTRVAHRIGRAQSAVILWLIYFLAVPLFALVTRRARGRFGSLPAPGTAWRPTASPATSQARGRTPSLESARRQA